MTSPFLWTILYKVHINGLLNMLSKGVIMELKDLLNFISDTANENGKHADWYIANLSQGLADIERYVQRSVLDFVEFAHNDCKTIDEVEELLDVWRQDASDNYKILRAEGFERLAEMSIAEYACYCDIAYYIERNK